MAKNSEEASPARHVVHEFTRSLWHLRDLLAFLIVPLFLLSVVMYFVGGPVESGSRTPSWFAQTLYFCAITALTVGYGDVVPTTTPDRIDSVLLGVFDVLMMGMVTAVAVQAVQEAARRAGRQR
ncbi:two pore domain potassium channel family protein [Paraburkholderia sp. CNPSo 3157]|uniref:Two pore domain potassium channel family protein n=1 Tax=Paraburkholderia franconis TaxID=2654983 RepID=A0A7X1NA22_9BURK|nr:potassium channel family protein [Paraburkholderia franconis]MPW18140.1 two pore domain potassium channel family protein [Paraburkholderia franconis]